MRALAELGAKIVGFTKSIWQGAGKPDGTPAQTGRRKQACKQGSQPLMHGILTKTSTGNTYCSFQKNHLVFIMKFKSIASRIIFSVIPIVILFTAIFIYMIYKVTNAQVDEKINEKMFENLKVSIYEIQNELIKNANIALSLAFYAETCSIDSINRGEMKDFIIRAIQSNKNTIGGGIWYEPYALYTDKRYFGPYVHIKGGKAIYEAEYADTVDYHAEDWYLNGKQSDGALVWSDVYHDPVPAVTMITATAPFYDAHRLLRGVATADMALTDIQAIIKRISVGKTGKAFILGAGGEYISFFDDNRSLNDTIQNDADANLAAFGKHALATGEGMAPLKKDGIAQRAYYKKMPKTHWTLVIVIDNDEIASSTLNSVLLLGIVPVVGLLLVTASIVSVARHLRAVAENVTGFAEFGAAGDFSRRMEVSGHDEFGRMQAHLNTMMENSSKMHARQLEMLEAAQAASKAKSNFLATMSHEMRTPMNAVIGMTNIAKASHDIEKKDHCLNKISEASTHLLGVINDILDMSKIEANKFELSYANFDFEKMLRKASNVIAFRVGEKKQNFNVHIDQRIPRFLNGDEQRLAQVVTNLLSNAVKFTPEGGCILLNASLAEEDNGVYTIQIEVSDTGIGIPEEQQARLFTSFEQADSSIARKFGGTGLGLAISKRIVEMMDGRIWIVSEPDKGSTFTFTIRAGLGVEEQHHHAPAWMDRRKALRVLVVDDDAYTREYFQEILQAHGIFCETAANGEEACEKIRNSGPYSICFVDWRMPGMDGIELARTIKTDDGNKATVVMISASDWSMLKSDAKHVGVDAFLPKPLFPSDICNCINACLGADRLMTDHESLPGEAGCFQGYRILLAEDVDVNREIVLSLLEPTQLAIDCAENGAEAVRMFEAAPDSYDMIFMDVQMPEMDGYEATRRIRALEVPRAKTVPIVAMTANVFREDIEKSAAAGMNDHVGKPLDFAIVLNKLRTYLPQGHRNDVDAS